MGLLCGGNNSYKEFGTLPDIQQIFNKGLPLVLYWIRDFTVSKEAGPLFSWNRMKDADVNKAIEHVYNYKP